MHTKTLKSFVIIMNSLQDGSIYLICMTFGSHTLLVKETIN